MDVNECPEEGPLFRAVLRLAKAAKATVGFLPDSAFGDRAAKGTLLVATIDGSVAGYVLYDLPRDEVRVRQLVTEPRLQQAGVARRLLDEVAARHPERRGIVLECRRDFPAHRVWPQLDFAPIGERVGRSLKGLPLTIWFRDFGHPNLFTLEAEEGASRIAALDVNVVIDLADEANTSSRHLAEDWVSSAVRFAVTEETLVELDKRKDADTRRRHRDFLGRFSRLTAAAGKWRPLEAELIAAVRNPTKFAADLRQAARAAAGGASWMVTRDERFRRACGAKIKQVLDLDVVSPPALIRAADVVLRGDTYRPVDLAGTEIVWRDLGPSELDAAAHQFVNQRSGESLSTFRDELNRVAAQPQTHRVLVLVDGAQLIGLAVVMKEVALRVQICRVARIAGQATIARQLLGLLRSEATEEQNYAVCIRDQHASDWLVRAAPDEGFLPTSAGHTAVGIPGSGTRVELRRAVLSALALLDSSERPLAARDLVTDAEQVAPTLLEATFMPFLVLGEEVPNFVIPIQPAWAAELVDADLARSQLFARSRVPALQREHVYYRSPRASAGLKAPARLLWYVSGKGPHSRTMPALSLLRDVVVGDADRLYQRFAHLGIYERGQVQRVAADGRVMALRFTHTRALPRPISLNSYRAVMGAQGAGLTLQGPQRLTEQTFDKLLRMTI